MSSASPAVLVHNSDGINPYAAEIASLLRRRGLRTSLLDAANSANRPARAVRWMRVLPANYGDGSAAHQALSLLRGLGITLRAGLLRGEVVVVAFTRFPLEDLVLAALGALGRPVVLVVHNPVPREAESAPARFARRALLRTARMVVVHADRLVSRVDDAARAAVRVCPHPPYVQTVPPAGPTGTLDPARRWVAFVGALRWDKGFDRVPQVLALVPADVRRTLGLVVCGTGDLPAGLREQLHDWGVALKDLTADRPVPQEVLLDVLRDRPLVLAPYVAATQSGSVILALSTGCEVLAFDEGGIPDVLTSDGLVATDDVAAMARALTRAATGGSAGTSLRPVQDWAEDAADAWAAAVLDV